MIIHKICKYSKLFVFEADLIFIPSSYNRKGIDPLPKFHIRPSRLIEYQNFSYNPSSVNNGYTKNEELNLYVKNIEYVDVDLVNNKFKGYGILKLCNGDIISGIWKFNKGKCKVVYKDGNTYIGYIKKENNLYFKNGKGIIYYLNGDIYNGYWLNDLKQGNGEYYTNDTNTILKGKWYSDILQDNESNDIYYSIKDYISIYSFQLNNIYGFFDIICKNINKCNDFSVTIKICDNNINNKKYLEEYINNLQKMLSKNLKNFKDIISNNSITEEVSDNNEIYGFILKLELTNTRKMILKKLSKNKIEYSDIIQSISGNDLIVFNKIINTVYTFDKAFLS